MKKKLRIQHLEVESFVTKTIRGGLSMIDQIDTTDTRPPQSRNGCNTWEVSCTCPAPY
ncbi:hypothetical protein AB9P05_07720 [Roseivirga sp. BDSF3-8]|uniref:hypothetical protein n=1 Tax=Roseivirga sp. BDSF3-8 TaxID=3241598 RepID=UPI003531D1D0